MKHKLIIVGGAVAAFFIARSQGYDLLSSCGWKQLGAKLGLLNAGTCCAGCAGSATPGAPAATAQPAAQPISSASGNGITNILGDITVMGSA